MEDTYKIEIVSPEKVIFSHILFRNIGNSFQIADSRQLWSTLYHNISHTKHLGVPVERHGNHLY